MKRMKFILTILTVVFLAGTSAAQDFDAIVTPDQAELEVGQSLQFELFTFSFDANDQRSPLDADEVSWSVTPDSAGSITEDGFFVAGPNAGKAVVRAVIRRGDRRIVKEIIVSIGRLRNHFFELKVVPERAVVPAQAEQQFRVTLTLGDIAIRPASVRWEVLPDNLGRISADGLFQAGEEEGHGRVVAHVEIDGLQLRAVAHVVVSPAASGAITGAVVSDSDGSALAGAVIRAVRLGRIRWIQRAETNQDGEYTLGDLIPGIYVVTANARGFIGEFYDDTRNYLEASPLAISEGDTLPGIDFGLSAGATITGTVYAEADSTALQGAHVMAFLVVNPRFARHVTTDENGGYTLEALPSGSYAVKADGRGFKAEFYDDVTQLSEATFVSVQEPETEAGIDFALASSSAIGGVVTNALDGAPISGASVIVYGSSAVSLHDHRFLKRTRTNADGEYLIELRPGHYIVVAGAVGFNSEFFEDAPDRSSATLVEVKADSHTTGIDFDLVPRATISGTVTDELTGAPLVGAVVEAFKERPDANSVLSTAGFRARTDSTGSYLIEDVPAGRYIVAAKAEGFLTEFYEEASAKGDATILTVGENVSLTNINFTLSTGGSMTGMVATAEDSVPIPRALIQVFDSNSGRHVRAYTDENGLYEVSGLPTGSYLVQAIAEGFFSEFYENARHRGDATRVPVVAPSATPDIDFFLAPHTDRQGTIAGRVLSDGDEAALPGAVVIAVSPSRRIPHITFTGPLGFYRLTDLPAGRYFVFAWSPGFVGEFYDDATRFKDADEVLVAGQQVTAGINFDLSPVPRRGAYTIRGRIRRASDNGPAEGILVQARLNGEVEVNATTDADGSYVIAGLSAGEYLIEATGAGYNDGYFGGTGANDAAAVMVGEGQDADNVDVDMTEDTVTDISPADAVEVPQSFSLEQNFPNPFNPETNIRYQLAQTTDVVLRIYNITGQEVRALVSEVQPAGDYQVKWDGTDELGRQVASGLYIYRLQAGNQFKTSRMMMLLK